MMLNSPPMRAVIQRVTEASVRVDASVVGAIQHGVLVLLGIAEADTEADAQYIVQKLVGLRIFSDTDGKFNLSLAEVNGAILLVSQFTLFGDCRKGRRPSFTEASRPEHAIPLYDSVVAALRAAGVTVDTGIFGAHMEVHLINDGPVTLLLDSRKSF